MIEKICLECNKIFFHRNCIEQKFCTMKCAFEFQKKNRVARICINCKKENTNKLLKNQHCDECLDLLGIEKFKNHNIVKKCEVCQILYSTTILNTHRKETCSSKCQKILRFIFRAKYSLVCKRCDLPSCSNQITMNTLKLNISENHYCSMKCVNIARSQKASEMRKCTGTKPELKFAELLKENNIDYCTQYWINWKRGWKKFYDFYLPNIDTLIEVDGVYWHGKNLDDDKLNEQQTKTRENDKVKNQLALDQNYRLIRIWEDEIDNFNFELLKGKQ